MLVHVNSKIHSNLHNFVCENSILNEIIIRYTFTCIFS